MKRMVVLSAALLLIGAHLMQRERRRRAALRAQAVQLQSWEGEGGRAGDANAQPMSPP